MASITVMAILVGSRFDILWLETALLAGVFWDLHPVPVRAYGDRSKRRKG